MQRIGRSEAKLPGRASVSIPGSSTERGWSEPQVLASFLSHQHLWSRFTRWHRSCSPQCGRDGEFLRRVLIQRGRSSLAWLAAGLPAVRSSAPHAVNAASMVAFTSVSSIGPMGGSAARSSNESVLVQHSPWPYKRKAMVSSDLVPFAPNSFRHEAGYRGGFSDRLHLPEGAHCQSVTSYSQPYGHGNTDLFEDRCNARGGRCRTAEIWS
jgi:hypothetical protein